MLELYALRECVGKTGRLLRQLLIVVDPTATICHLMTSLSEICEYGTCALNIK